VTLPLTMLFVSDMVPANMPPPTESDPAVLLPVTVLLSTVMLFGVATPPPLEPVCAVLLPLIVLLVIVSAPLTE
jgi:hypothetical protein